MSDETTTAAPTPAPTPETTAAPEPQSTIAPAPGTTAPPAETTAASPAYTTTAAPAQSNTAAPAQSTTAAPAQSTTAAPAQSTTAAPAQSTTAAPAQSTTAAPAQTTTAAPAQTTTAAPAQTTTAAPAQTTTAVPAQSTTAEPVPTTTLPPTPLASILIDPDDGTAQNPLSVQVARSASLTLTWSATNAASVNIAGLSSGQPPSGSAPIPTIDGPVAVIAVAADGSQSVPCIIFVSTHEDGEVVSGHATVSSGIAAVISFKASKGGAEASSANVGDQITLIAFVSDATDSCVIGGEPAALTDLPGTGTKLAQATVTISMPMTGEFDCQVSAGGVEGAPASLHLELGAAPGTTTTEAEKADGQQLYSKRKTLGPDLPKGDHYSLSANVGAQITVFWQGTDDPPEMTALPSDLESQVDDGVKTKWLEPTWDQIKAGKWRARDYSDFWAHVKGTTGLSEEEGKNGEGEGKVGVGLYEFGYVDFTPAGGNEPAFTITLTGSLAQVNVKEPMASGIGVVEGKYALTLFSFTLDAAPFRVKVEISGELTAALVAATLEDVVKQIGKNPYAVAAAIVVLLTVGMIYMIIESPSDQDLLDLGNAARNLANRCAADYIAGLMGSDGSGDAYQAGANARSDYFSRMRKANPDASDDDINLTLTNQISDLTAQAQQSFYPSAQDAVWNSWAPQYSPKTTLVKNIALTPEKARGAWEFIFPGVNYDSDPRFSKYFPLTDDDQLDAAAQKAKGDSEAEQKLWSSWVKENSGVFGANRTEAQANYIRIFGNEDYGSDPLYQKEWG